MSLITFEANPALVLPFSMLVFGSVSCYGCSFVWIFCIRLIIWSFLVGLLFVLDCELWRKKIMIFFAKFDRLLIPKKVTEPNGCRFSLTFESRLRRRGVWRAQWLHVFPQK